MSHVDDGRLNALLDGELDAAEASAVRAHIAGCAECARRLEEAKQFLAGAADLLGALDLPATVNVPPAPSAAPVRRVSKTAKEVAIDIDGATHKSPAIRPNLPEAAPPAHPVRPRFDFAPLSWAAIVVLALGVGYLAEIGRAHV
jgi:anti-sigma factor RsiW